MFENTKAGTIMKYKPTYSDKQRDAARQIKEEKGRKRNVQEKDAKKKPEAKEARSQDGILQH